MGRVAVMRAALVLLLLAGGAAAVAYRRAAALDSAAAPEQSADPGTLEQITDQLPSIPSLSDWVDMNTNETNNRAANMLQIIDRSAQVRAMLETIARAEGTAGRADPYRVCYAYRHTVQSFADHPAITGEWRGEKLTDAQCRGAGLNPGCVSTAAGKYQITRPTWKRLKDRLKLVDFGPESQDAAAVELLRECGALPLIESGKLADAVGKARKLWASLPGAGYDQPERTFAWVQNTFTNAGGVVTA